MVLVGMTKRNMRFLKQLHVIDVFKNNFLTLLAFVAVISVRLGHTIFKVKVFLRSKTFLGRTYYDV